MGRSLCREWLYFNIVTHTRDNLHNQQQLQLHPSRRYGHHTTNTRTLDSTSNMTSLIHWQQSITITIIREDQQFLLSDFLQ